MSALLLEDNNLNFVFYGLPCTQYELKKLSVKLIIAERYKWKSLLRDRIQLNKLRPEEPIKNAKVVLTRYSMKPPELDSLKLSFLGIVDALLEYGIIKSCADINYKALKGKKNFGWINVEVSC